MTTAREQLEKDLHCMKSAMKVISRGSSNDDDNEGEENNKATMTSYVSALRMHCLTFRECVYIYNCLLL